MTLPSLEELPQLDWADWPTRYVFFTGKGGVGKTTTASAAAVALASSGLRTLLVSTDPASNLDDVFGVAAGGHPTPVTGVANLDVANIDPEQAAAEYRERTLVPYRGVLPESALVSMEEQLSGACTVEIAAFNEFTTILTSETAAGYDRVLFDTAPTGHTLRLLTLPSAWSGYAQQHPSGASCLGPLAGLDRQRLRYEQAVERLTDPAQTRLVLVARADLGALREAARASGELRALGVLNQQLVINGVLRHPESDPTAQAFFDRQQVALATAPAELTQIPVAAVELATGDLIGISALRRLAAGDAVDEDDAGSLFPPPAFNGLSQLVDELADAGHGVVMTMGKGGVGKTTVAAGIAVALADRGHEVTLSTTDPAAHLSEALAGEAHTRLRVERIDPAVETDRYSTEVIAAATGP